MALNGQYVSVAGQGVAKVRTEDLLFLKEMMEKGVLKPVIDRSYSFEQMADAHRYVEIGHKKGDVAIKVGHNREL
ncbi:zinc-binding dehydrogenase [Paenibacillus elgii]|uniref:zinc-binding dehydrogenase n=1 Tax=Paenibacillus elgii TaxID=189691 RepID=UPI000248DD84|nr:zinc-binding dehydrogenase [Paenibacillus elgii]